MAKKQETTETVTVVKDQALALVNQSGDATEVELFNRQMEEDAGAGLENLGANDLAIPFLAILQKGSPQVDELSAKFIEESSPGMVINTVTNDLYQGKVGVVVVPCAYKKKYVEWKPRDSGGGLVGHHEEGSQAMLDSKIDERGKRVLPNGNIIVDTAYHYVLLIREDGLPEWAVVAMSSTQLKKSRNWNTVQRRVMVRSASGKVFNPPSFAYSYRLTTVGESKDKYTWFGWSITAEGRVTDPDIYRLAKEFNQAVISGKVEVSAPPRDFDATHDDIASAEGESLPF